jgi:hypothetical protein
VKSWAARVDIDFVVVVRFELHVVISIRKKDALANLSSREPWRQAREVGQLQSSS